MKINYNIGEKVSIQPNGILGTVIGIFISDKQIKFQVRYFQNGEPKDNYFYDFELKESNKPSLGFTLERNLK